MRKRILKDFELTEISGVDRPAQTPATMTIIKRERAKEPDMSAEELKALKKSMEELNAELALAKGMAGMSDMEKEYMSGMDDEKKKGFMGMSPEERKKKMEMSKRNDEVLEVAGAQVHKSAVGDALFGVLKQQQEEIQRQANEVNKAREIAMLAGFVKKAQSEYSHLPGSAEQVGQLLRETADLSKSAQETLGSILKALETSSAEAFVTKGASGSGDGDKTVVEKLDALTKAHAEKNNLDYATAYAQVIEKNADLYEQTLAG